MQFDSTSISYLETLNSSSVLASNLKLGIMDGSSSGSCMLEHGFSIIDSTASDQPLAISHYATAQGTAIIKPIVYQGIPLVFCNYSMLFPEFKNWFGLVLGFISSKLAFCWLRRTIISCSLSNYFIIMC